VAKQITLSPTRIRRWVRCRKSYDWRYNQKLVKVKKDYPLTLGLAVGDALASYYSGNKEFRSQDSLNSALASALLFHKPRAGDDKELLEEGQKVAKISQSLLANYHEWASVKDDFEVVMIETSRKAELAPNVSLMAIPDAIIITPEEIPLILEHKVRHRYRPGDFGMDYQSVSACIVSSSIGTLYNVLEYGKGKYHREPIIRSEQELNYFKDMFIQIGQDILSTPPERMYPMPMRRCSCEYWELCNGEIQGLDVEDIISELYQTSTPRPKEEVKKQPEEV